MAEGKEISDISGRSKFFFNNTMLCLLKGLEGKRVTVEVRNDLVIEGDLERVDPSMGLTMSRVLLTSVRGKLTQLEYFHIQGRQIRYVHIPDELNIVDTMKLQLNQVKTAQEKERQNRKAIFMRKQQRQEKEYKMQDEKNKFVRKRDSQQAKR